MGSHTASSNTVLAETTADAFFSPGAAKTGPNRSHDNLHRIPSGHLAGQPAQELSNTAAAVRGGLAPWQIRKVERFVKENMTRPLRIEQLADQVSLSASYFHHAFKETFALSPHANVTRKRLENARAMMLATEEPLSQISFACGFADQSHLCKIFRREMGEPPSAWRKRNRPVPAFPRCGELVAISGLSTKRREMSRC